MISKPTLLINKDICIDNIEKMYAKSKTNGCTFRPHFKTHQSAEIGKWFQNIGINKCTVSSVEMAKYFFNAGWKDITIAFPLNILEFDEVCNLSASIKINICIESIEVASFLAKNTKLPLGIFIKIDAGYHRTGVDASSFTYIQKILQILQENVFCNFQGFLQHAGHSYHTKDSAEVLAIHESTTNSLKTLKSEFITQYPDLIISCGDTPTCSIAETFDGIDELRPGNFAFYDVMQAHIGSCDYGNIAVAMACPVVAKHTDRNEIIIYGGAIHFSKDYIMDEQGQKIFGLISKDKDDWSVVHDQVYLKKLSQEHGTIHATAEFLEKIQVGDLLFCLPIHSCLTANLMNGYLSTNGEKIPMFRYQANY